METVLTEKHDTIFVVTFNRPARPRTHWHGPFVHSMTMTRCPWLY
jgi:hypothetical protein